MLRRISTLPTTRCKKFASRWYGPFRILELRGVNAIIRPCHKPRQEPETVHINKLKPCYFQDIPEVQQDKTPSEEPDSSDKEKSDSDDVPLKQYVPKAKEPVAPKPVSPIQKDEVKKSIDQAPVKTYNLRSRKI